MSTVLESLWDKLSLTDEFAKEVVIEEEWTHNHHSPSRKCLLGRLAINRSANKEAMKTIFSKVWKLEGSLTIKKITERLFTFHFGEEHEKDKVLLGQPWSFNKSLLLLNEMEEVSDPNQVNLDWCPFWVQVHGLPLKLMTKKVGAVLGETIGEVLEIETDENGVAWGKWLRMRVSINTSEPLKRGSSLTVSGGGSQKVAFRYEKLPDFCYVCGILNHTEQDCPKAINRKKEGKTVERGYDPWLRADGQRLIIPQQSADERWAPNMSTNKIAKSAWWLTSKLKSEANEEESEQGKLRDKTRLRGTSPSPEASSNSVQESSTNLEKVAKSNWSGRGPLEEKELTRIEGHNHICSAGTKIAIEILSSHIEENIQKMACETVNVGHATKEKDVFRDKKMEYGQGKMNAEVENMFDPLTQSCAAKSHSLVFGERERRDMMLVEQVNKFENGGSLSQKQDHGGKEFSNLSAPADIPQIILGQKSIGPCCCSPLLSMELKNQSTVRGKPKKTWKRFKGLGEKDISNISRTENRKRDLPDRMEVAKEKRVKEDKMMIDSGKENLPAGCGDQIGYPRPEL